ncbi:larval cuticle protein 65Ag1-like [Teleopsis dalmanni]|uniref:larval cuticle protein 65Ag1-like n=1 Tax=Teleopsis dalmanni TaxID=139649 RepID=UPI0018CE55CB|nr:larval cuticle protein 65Ag1-like [Teleopsis dalmanni]
MKFVIVFAALLAVALARPDAEITRLDSDVQPEGFKFGVATSDGFIHDAEGHLLNVGSDHEEISVKGSYSFVGDDGQTYTVNYIADANGFQPQGAHLPVAPEA